MGAIIIFRKNSNREVIGVETGVIALEVNLPNGRISLLHNDPDNGVTYTGLRRGRRVICIGFGDNFPWVDFESIVFDMWVVIDSIADDDIKP